MKSQLIGKDPDAGKDWKQKEKRAAEDEMVGQHHQLNGHDLKPTPGDSEGQGAWHATLHRVAKSQTWISNWKTTTKLSIWYLLFGLFYPVTTPTINWRPFTEIFYSVFYWLTPVEWIVILHNASSSTSISPYIYSLKSFLIGGGNHTRTIAIEFPQTNYD